MAFKKPVDPTKTRLSSHFLLSDFLGNHSVYSKGYANIFDANGAGNRIPNLQALCETALEPILENYGPLSISYGYVSPELSRKVVSYQDPDQPSHHRADLGAACDFVSHRWVAGEFPTIEDLYLPESARGSPIALMHAIDYMEIPYSRLISYSESPYICIAVSAAEVAQGKPRNAFYENRYQGKPKAKPEYIQLSTVAARRRHLRQLQELGLEHDWRGGGYPSYHNEGRRKYQHRRVSRYTVLSDWLYHKESVEVGEKNIPSLNIASVQDAFAAAGLVYDAIITSMDIPRASIVKSYVSHVNPYSEDDGGDWRQPHIKFLLALPEGAPRCLVDLPGVSIYADEFLEVTVDVDEVLNNPAFS